MKQKLPIKKVKTRIEEMLEKALKEKGLTEKDSKKIYIDPKKKKFNPKD